MSKSIFMNYFFTESEFVQKFEELTNHHPNFDHLIINNVPSTTIGLKLISQDWFKSKILGHQYLLGLKLRINEKLARNFGENLIIFDYSFKNSILITFQSTLGDHESKTYWRINRTEKYYSLNIENDLSENITYFTHEFLIEQIKSGQTGILESYRTKTEIHLQEIGDNEGNNLLRLAIIRMENTIVQNLLENKFDTDKAIDLAWLQFDSSVDGNTRNRCNEIILSLLRGNSRLPDDFDYDKSSKEVQEFIDMCEELHKAVDDDKFEYLEEKLNLEPNLIHYYNRNNESLLAHSFKNKKLKICHYLDKGITIGNHENLNEIYENLSDDEFITVRIQHQTSSKEFTESHLLALRFKSRIGSNDKDAQLKWKYIDDALTTLNGNEYCKKIMKVAAEFKKLTIYFDFKHESIYYLDPATDNSSKGIVYEGGSIIIGAKNLTDNEKKFHVFGHLAHELCHFAVCLAFMNQNFDPFPLGESNIKTRYINDVMTQCKDRKDSERIVANVLGYDEDLQDSEMIVTVPQMLMTYHENKDKIKELEGTYDELFRYSRNIVEPELDRALPILKILGDEDKRITFKDLTEPMKAKILHSSLEFQGVETSFYELVGNDHQVLSHLTSKHIRDVLLKHEVLKLNSICDLKLKYGIMERSFLETNSYDKIYEKFKYNKDDQLESYYNDLKKYKNDVQQIRDETKIFLLSDHAGSGKTTIFMNYAKKLKNEFPNHWISFIRLRNYLNVFDKTKNADEINDIKDVRGILCNIVNLKSNVEKAIFLKLFNDGKAILLFDGVDEICPKHTELLMKIFKILKEKSTNNEIWISTRPHYASKLEQIFKISMYRFTPFTSDEVRGFIEKILIQNKAAVVDNQSSIPNTIYMFTSGVMYRKNQEMDFKDCPLIIELITELYIEDALTFSPINFYSVFSAVVEKQRTRLGDKVPTKDRDVILKFSVWDVHRVLALISIIGDDLDKELGFKLEELSIMKKWKKEKKNWTSDMIQRYGFVIANLDDPNERSSIDFMHKTYGEFFVVQFLIDFVFDDHSGTDKNEVKKIFKLLVETLLKRKKGYEILQNMFNAYIREKFENTTEIFDEKVKDLLIAEIPKTYNDYDFFSNFTNLVHKDHEICARLWQIKKDYGVLLEICLADGFPNFASAMNLAEKCFGLNWHHSFNRSGKKLIDDKDLDVYLPTTEVWSGYKEVLKLLDLADKNFRKGDLEDIYNKLDLSNGSSQIFLEEIISRMKNVLKKEVVAQKCLDQLNSKTTSSESLKFAYNEVEKALDYNRTKIRSILFPKKATTHTQLFGLFRSKSLESFEVVRDFYKKYKNSWQDIQDLFLQFSLINSLHPLKCPFYPEYKEFVREVFGNNPSKLAKKIFENFETTEFNANEEQFLQNHQDFFSYVFTDDVKFSLMLSKLKMED